MDSSGLNIAANGIVHRLDDGTAVVVRAHPNGGIASEIELPRDLADAYRLADGDVVEGTVERIDFEGPSTSEPQEAEWKEEQWDEPAAVRGLSVLAEISTRNWATGRLATVERVNGLSLSEAEERPAPRRRHPNERTSPDRWVRLGQGETGRMLDIVAPLGTGGAGIIFGPHASGLTRTLRDVASGIQVSAPDILMLIVLLRARGEEITDWRRRFPDADVVVCPAAVQGARPQQTLRMADLVLECARRQTELGRHVVMLVDSLTGLWGTMLEVEGADVQVSADRSASRRRIREWIQAAGNFGGQPPLGGGLGGSLTLIGAVWNQEIDPEAEEEREVHPHLRLLDHVLHETIWRVSLSGVLAHRRIYPAIDSLGCQSLDERSFVPAHVYERLIEARSAISGHSVVERQRLLVEAAECAMDD